MFEHFSPNCSYATFQTINIYYKQTIIAAYVHNDSFSQFGKGLQCALLAGMGEKPKGKMANCQGRRKIYCFQDKT